MHSFSDDDATVYVVCDLFGGVQHVSYLCDDAASER